MLPVSLLVVRLRGFILIEKWDWYVSGYSWKGKHGRGEKSRMPG